MISNADLENLKPHPDNVCGNILWKPQKSDRKKEIGTKSRRLLLMRHGERIDFKFGTWIPYCFDKNGTYIRKDVNMPETLPKRSQGPNAYLKDTPLTNVGVLQATQVGEGLKSKKIEIAFAYSSPALRCIQTCDSLLRGCNKLDAIKIRIEPGLFEWGRWYENNYPDFMTAEELTAAGFNIDTTYEPIVKESDLKQVVEDCETYYQRNSFVAKSALNAHPNGNILLVGHSATLDVCSRELFGKKPRKVNEMIEVIRQVPYCGLIQVAEIDEGKWEIVEPSFSPATHKKNRKFDYKTLLN